MKRIAKKTSQLSLSAILLLVMSLDMSAFAGVLKRQQEKIDVLGFRVVLLRVTLKCIRIISVHQTGTIAVMLELMRSLMQQALSLRI